MFGVYPICRVLTEYGMAIARSAYYAHKNTGSVTEAALTEAYAANAVFSVFERNRWVYGNPQDLARDAARRPPDGPRPGSAADGCAWDLRRRPRRASNHHHHAK